MKKTTTPTSFPRRRESPDSGSEASESIDKATQEKHLIDMMSDDEDLGLYDDPPVLELVPEDPRTAPLDRAKALQLWRKRLQLVEEHGTFKTGYGQGSYEFFSRKGYGDKQARIDYIKLMITKIENP